MKFLYLTSPAFFFMINLSMGQVYKISPNSAFELGKGIDLRRVDQGKTFALFKDLTPVWENQTGTPSTSVYEQIITSEQDYQSSRGMDINLSARYFGASLDASYQSNKQEILNSSSLTLSFVASSDFGRQVLKKILPTDMEADPAALISAGKYDEFVQKYGNYFVNAVRRTASITVYLIITSIKQDTKSSLTATAKGGYSSGPGTGFSASASLNSEVSQAIKDKRTMISIQSSGDSSGFAGLRDLLTNALQQVSPMDKIAEIIRNYVGQFKRENSIISEYHLTPMTSLNVPRNYISWDEATDNRIVDLYQQYIGLQKIKDKYQLLQNDVTYNSLVTDNDKSSIDETITNLNKDLYYLSKRRDSCLYECQSSRDIYSCCTYNVNFYQPNPIFSRYWDYYNLFHHIYNYPSILKVADTLDLVNASVPPLHSRKIRVSFKYAFDRVIPAYLWDSELHGKFVLLVNGRSYESAFTGHGYTNPVYTTNDDGVQIPEQGMYDVFSTDAVTVTSDTLKVRLVLTDYRVGPEQNPSFKPADGPIRLLPNNSIKIELVQ